MNAVPSPHPIAEALSRGEPYDTGWRFFYFGDLPSEHQDALVQARTIAGGGKIIRSESSDPIRRIVDRYKGRDGDAQPDKVEGDAIGILDNAAKVSLEPTTLLARKFDVRGKAVTGYRAFGDLPADAILAGDVITRILASRDVDPARRGGVRLSGARITGATRLDGAGGAEERRAPVIHLTHCYLDEAVQIDVADIEDLDLSGSFLPRLSAERCRIRKDLVARGVHLRGGEFDVTSAVIEGSLALESLSALPGSPHVYARFVQGRIGGSVSLSQSGKRGRAQQRAPQAGARGTAPAEAAERTPQAEEDANTDVRTLVIKASRVRIAGDLDLSRSCLGETDFEEAEVCGNVSLSNATIVDRVNLDSARIGGGLTAKRAASLDQKKSGRITANGATIGLELRMESFGSFPDNVRVANGEYFPCDFEAPGLRVAGLTNLVGARLRRLVLRDGQFGNAFEAWALRIGPPETDKTAEAEHASPAGAPPGDTAAMDLEAVTIAGRLSLDGARIACMLNLSSAEIEGDLRLNGCQLGDGECSLLGDHIRIKGSLLASETAFSGYRNTLLYAKGIFSLDLARIGGDALFVGATIIGKTSALYCPDAHFGGGLSLMGVPRGQSEMHDGTPTRLEGLLELRRARVDGGLVFANARILAGALARAEGETETHDPDDVEESEEELVAVYAKQAVIRGGIRAEPVDAGAAASAAPPPDYQSALERGTRTLDKSTTPEEVASARRSLEAVGGTSTAAVSDTFTSQRIEGAVAFEPRDNKEKRVSGLDARGAVAFIQTTIEGDVGFEGGNFVAPLASSWGGYTLLLRGSQISGRVNLCAGRKGMATEPFFSKGQIDIGQCVIGQGLDLGGGTFEVATRPRLDPPSRAPTALDAVGAKITGPVFLRRHDKSRSDDEAARVRGALDFDRATIVGDFRILDATFAPGEHGKRHDAALDAETDNREFHYKRDVVLSLRNTVIDGDFLIESPVKSDAKHPRRGIVNLTGAKLRAIVDNGGRAWGTQPLIKDGRLREGVQLRLEGCVYERLQLEDASIAEARVSRRSPACFDRRWWLMRQFPALKRHARCEGGDLGAVKFKRSSWARNHRTRFPEGERVRSETYEQAARVLRRGGYHDMARQVAIEGMNVERRSGAMQGQFVARRMHWLHGAFYGYGYSGIRAFWTLFALLAIGTLCAWVQMSSGRIVDAESLKQGRLQACTSETPLLYAVDAMLVGIDLGPEERCTFSAKLTAPTDFSLGTRPLLGDGLEPLSRQISSAWAGFMDLGVAPLKLGVLFSPPVQQVAGMIFSLLGSIALLLAALTFTGALRRDKPES